MTKKLLYQGISLSFDHFSFKKVGLNKVEPFLQEAKVYTHTNTGKQYPYMSERQFTRVDRKFEREQERDDKYMKALIAASKREPVLEYCYEDYPYSSGKRIKELIDSNLDAYIWNERLGMHVCVHRMAYFFDQIEEFDEFGRPYV